MTEPIPEHVKEEMLRLLREIEAGMAVMHADLRETIAICHRLLEDRKDYEEKRRRIRQSS